MSLGSDVLSDIRQRFSLDAVGMTMTDWAAKHTTIKGRPFSVRGYEFQRAIMDDFHPNVDVIKCSQVGLALALDTPVPTVKGWTSMGDIQVGDIVFDEVGKPCTVQYVSPIYTDHQCYQITFDTGETLVADENHRWYVEADRSFNMDETYAGSGRPPNGTKMFKSGILATKDIFTFHKHGIRNRFAIPNTQALETEPVNLLVDPYVLGLWLGDGNTHAACLTAHIDDAPHYETELKRRGVKCAPSSSSGNTLQFMLQKPNQVRPGRGILNSIHNDLRNLGLIGIKKYVPKEYMRASREQRLDLMRGMLDTDGSITKNGRVSFYNTNSNLINSFEELAHSLGFKTRTRWRLPSKGMLKSGHAIHSKLDIAEVSFVAYSDEPVFLLPRKRERLVVRERSRPSEALRRRIISVSPVSAVPVRCLSVDSASHLFLVGKGMIPTHNTEVQIRKALGFAVRNQGRSLLFTLPDEKLCTKIAQTRFNPIIDDDRIFNQERDAGATRSKEIKQFGRSFIYITGCTESDATSTSADAIFNDEVDLSPQDMLALFNSRLQNSDLKISQRFSTPSFPGFGIDLGYQNSDQKLYMCKCERCNFWNWPQFNRQSCFIPGLPDRVQKLTDITQQMIDEEPNFSLSESYVKCENCDAQLDLGNPSLREWVAKYPKRSKDAHGYYVTPFATSRIDLPYILRQLLDYKRRDYMRGFHNTVLGETYVNGEIRLEEDVIRACFDRSSPSIPDVSKDTPVAVGIDMGLVCHVTVSLLSGAVFLFATVPSAEIEEYVEKLCQKYKVVAGGVDRFPYTPTAENIWKISNGRIIPLEYHERGREISTIKDPYGTITHGQINRTMGLDKVANLIRNRNISFAGYGYYETTIIEHLRDQIRDEQPEKPAVWKKLTGRDHFHHSLAFLFMGIEMRELITSIESNGVKTEIGWGIAKLQVPKQTSLFNPFGNRGVAKRRDTVYQRY